MNQPGWLMECGPSWKGFDRLSGGGPNALWCCARSGEGGDRSVDEVKVLVRWLKGRNPWTLIDGIDGLSGPIFFLPIARFFFLFVFLDTASDGGFLFRFFCLWCSVCPEKWHPSHTALRLLLRWIAPSILWHHFGPGAGLTFGESQGRHPRNLAS